MGSWRPAAQSVRSFLNPPVEVDTSHVASESTQYAVQQASYAAAIAPLPTIAIASGTPRPVSDFRTDGSSSDRAELMLRRARHMVDDGPAFESNVSVRATIFGQTVVGSGSYLQAGQGEGKTRTSLAFHAIPTDGAVAAIPTTPPEHEVLNLCDGRFVYRLQQDLINGDRTLEFYDLQQIKNSKAKRKQSGVQPPRAVPLGPGELMASGVAGLLQHLADEFRFAIVDQPESSRGNTRLLRGTWNPRRLHNMLRDRLSPEQLEAGLAWSQLPPNLPHAVEVTLEKTSAWDLFPSQIRFYQFQTHDDRTMAHPIVVIQYQPPRPIDTVSQDQFVFHSDNLEATDLTQQYLSRLRPSVDEQLR